MKKIVFVLCLMFLGLLSLTGCSDNIKYDIVATNFVGYDAARSVLDGNTIVVDKQETRIKMLLKPGSDVHSYQPSATDIRSVLNCKIFIYVGGESDSEWVESDILGNIKDKNIKVISMFEVLKDRLIMEEDEEEYDEHVWTNPENYCLIVEAIKEALVEIDNENKETYITNATSVINVINTIDNNLKYIINNEARVRTIVVADRNPFRYMASHYGLNIVGALEGCSSDKNVPTSKIIELKNVVEENRLKYIFSIELSDGAIANSVYNEVMNNNYPYNLNKGILYSMQNISADDYNNKKTYSYFLSLNFEVLKRALSL